METNKQNTALLVVIAVATLLVAVVGATFAYFTAQNSNAKASVIEVATGSMTIKYEDGTSAALLTEENFQPRPDALVDKTFSITGKNTTIGNGEKGMDMPFTVDFEYTNEFTNNTTDGKIEYAFTRKDENAGNLVTVTIDTASGSLENSPETAKKLRLAHGVFKADSTASTTITFNLKLYFKDTGVVQDENKFKKLTGQILINDNEKENAGTTQAAA